RHTRSYGDWSSDVCSSDLSRKCSTSISWVLPKLPESTHEIEVEHFLDYALAALIRLTPNLSAAQLWQWIQNAREYPWSQPEEERSEERRVGKEVRCRVVRM